MFQSAEGRPRKGMITVALAVFLILGGGIELYSTTSTASAMAFNSSSIQQNHGRLNNNGNQEQITSNSQSSQNQTFVRHGAGGRRKGSMNPFLVILQYSAIFAVIIVPTYFIETRFFNKKNRLKTN